MHNRRFVGSLIMAVSACAGSGSVDEPADPPVPIMRGAFKLAEVVESTSTETRVRIDRRDVPLREMPIADYLGGLPMSGNANVAIDVVVPIVNGAHVYPQARGSIQVSCPHGCTLGDDVATLRPAGNHAFGHVTFDELDVRVELRAGRLEITRWHAVSPQLELTAALDVELATVLGESTLDGCIGFRPSPTLAERDPNTAAVLATTGAHRADDDHSYIKIAGRAGTRKLLGQSCDLGGLL